MLKYILLLISTNADAGWLSLGLDVKLEVRLYP